jgi:hypothetical protein
MGLFTATGKPNFFFLQLEMLVACTTGDTVHVVRRCDIQVLATHALTWMHP